MAEIVETIIRQGGVTGAFALFFAFACMKLYKDLMRCKDARVNDLRSVSYRIEQLKVEQETKHRESMRELNETLKKIDRFMDKFFDWMTHRG